jgi:hypothetical protein
MATVFCVTASKAASDKRICKGESCCFVVFGAMGGIHVTLFFNIGCTLLQTEAYVQSGLFVVTLSQGQLDTA